MNRALHTFLFILGSILLPTLCTRCLPTFSDSNIENVLLLLISGTDNSLNICSKTPQEVTQPENGSTYLAYIQSITGNGSSGSPTVLYLTVSTLQWGGPILAANGSIYGVPYNSDKVLKVNPSSDTTTEIQVSGITASNYFTFAYGFNDKLFAVPFGNSSVVPIFDPATDTGDLSTITSFPLANSNYYAGVSAPNGKIYFPPYGADEVMILDPQTNSLDNSTITGLGAGPYKWMGGVLASNGKIYTIAKDSTEMLIIDPTSNTVDTSSITGLPGGNAYGGGALAPNGKIYFVPRDANHVLIVDPATNSKDSTSITGFSGTTLYYGAVLGADGRIYGIPRNSGNVLVIDPDTNSTTTIATVGIFLGGALASNGKIYAMPQSNDKVLVIDTKANASFCDSVLRSGYMNKF
ncbi:MAG: hypothetical protein KDK30_08960 [Leptospiraceae bacterium]|nr:hypothetical protein [Leptospiraceae bacterium]